MSEKEKLLALVKKNINLAGVFADLLDELLEPALQKVVADTSNPFDDMLMASVYPILEKELKELAAKKIDDLLS